jgi:acetolactate synthase-1/2/3 large subunit
MRNGMPNFAQVANAYNIGSICIDKFEDLENAKFLKESKNNPFLIDVNVMEKENCYPMVAPGRSNSQMLGLDIKN